MAGPDAVVQTTSIHPETQIGAVDLTVSNLERSRRFYEAAIGLRCVDLEDGGIALHAGGVGPALVTLHGDQTASALNRRATGLYHLAILLPSRVELAYALARLAEQQQPLDGASDHLVSEALYLSDPDGNGIEIYRDRPSAEWSRSGGQIEMATLPLDLRSILAELPERWDGDHPAPAATTIGHVHLQVSDLKSAEWFYSGVLGFDVTVRGYPGALFISAGGYHHHIGLNTWHSAGASPPVPGSVGLRHFDVVLPDGEELKRVLERVRAAGLPVEMARSDGDRRSGVLVRDPAGNGLRLRAA